jgi:serine/threonine protein kinase
MPPPPAPHQDKNDLFTQYQILEDLGDFPNYSLFKVKGPNGTIKLWKKVDLQFNAASIETRLLPVIEKVQHPNLNGVSNSFLFPDKGLLFVESEFPVKTLRHRLDEIRSNSAGAGLVGVPVGELFGYIAMAAEAIDFLNTSQHPYQGKKIAIYHRALSPDSLHLFEEKGKIICKVGDFGLAKPIIDNNEAARHSLGLTNYDYAPPEFDEGLTTNTSDQYSLATTYVELRTGRLPFTGTLLQKLQAQLNGTPDLSLLEPGERPVLARALSREPQARFPSCREFVRQLQQALGGVATLPVMTQPTRGNAFAGGGAPAAAEPLPSGGGGALFGGGNSGWSSSSRPVGRSGGSLFNVQSKSQVATPAKPEGFSMPAASVQASAAPAVSKAPVPPAPPPEKAPPVKPGKATRVPTPRPADGWTMEMPEPARTEKQPVEKTVSMEKAVQADSPVEAAKTEAVEKTDTANWTPGKVTAVSKGLSSVDMAVTPPPPIAITPPTPKPSMSNKARETLELIKRKQAGQSVAPVPVVEKSGTGAKMRSGSTASVPFLPPPATGKPPARASRAPGALGETPAPPRPQNVPTPRRASTPNMGMPLPTRHQPSIAARQKSPLPVPQQAGASPADATYSDARETESSGGGTSILTMFMVLIAAFCIGMIILFLVSPK